MAICRGAGPCFATVPRRGMFCRQCKVRAGIEVCAAPGCASMATSRGLCLRHWRAARSAGTLPPIRRPPLRVVERRTYDDPDRAGLTGPTDEARRRAAVRRAIEAKEAELHLARMLGDSDW